MKKLVYDLHSSNMLDANAPFIFDLKQFSAEDEGRTEQPTERKRQKSREEGSIPKSQELVSISVFLLCFWLVCGLAKFMYMQMMELMTYFLNHFSDIFLTKNNIQSFSIFLVYHIFTIIGPLLIVSVIGALLLNLVQTKFLFTPKKIAPNFSKTFGQIFTNMKKMFFSKETFFNLFKSLLKVFIVFGIGFFFMINDIQNIILLSRNSAGYSLSYIAYFVFKFISFSGILLFVISIADYFFQRMIFTESIKMTKQEVKDEFKELEGNPEIKQKIRQIQQQLANRRMMEDIKTADVVITNPTHYAVALKYDSSYMSAPMVVAKGVDHMALRLKKIASEHDVLLYENIHLARSLYASVDLGQEIPSEFYKVISDILSIVYTSQNKVMI